MSAVHRTPLSALAAEVGDLPTTVLPWAAPGLDEPLALGVTDAPPAPGAPVRGTFLLLHGEPSWSRLYVDWIPRLTAAGYRCVAPDLPGFGRSDKPVEEAWYSYERHCAAIAHVIATLDLRDVHLVVQDWAGPIGLRQLVDHPERFSRVFIFNTWLHHQGYPYSEGIHWWHRAAADPAELGGDMPCGDVVAMGLGRPHDLEAVRRAFDAPFDGPASKAGARAFPAMLPFARPEVGGAAQQQRCHDALLTWTGCPVHVVFGDADPIFTFAHGETWASQIPGATLDRIEGAGHFVQLDAPDDCLAVLSRHLGHDV